MNLLNIHNQKRLVYLFTRDKNDELNIIKDNTFYPYYYEIVDLNRYNDAIEYTYDNLPVKKIICSEPRDVGQQRTVNSYEADILFTKRYITDKVDKFDKTLIKYLFLDIEVLSKEMPDPYEAKDTISCITIYNSLYKNIQTWFLPDFKSEQEMLDNFVEYIKNEEIDVIFAWNMEFDYVYLFKRIQNFAKRISPIAQARYSDLQDILYPAGISIMDYMGMFKKIYMK
jgi:DNA polymerase elongation subunit (family B)